MVTADNTLKTLGDGIRYNYVQGASVTGNTIVNTVGNPVFCGTLSDPTVPVRVTNSTGVAVSGNSSEGYGTS